MISLDQANQFRQQAGLAPLTSLSNPSAPATKSANDIVAQRKAALGLDTTTNQTEPAQSNSVGEFAKSLVSAPATMLARPVQAAQSAGHNLGMDTAGLTKASEQGSDTMVALVKARNAAAAQGKDVSHFDKTIADMKATPDYAAQANAAETDWQPSSGGIIAPAPQNMGDVEKDVGRGIETVGLGLGPIAGGAAIGAGSSIEAGNSPLSLQTAFQTALGAAGGKLLDVVGKPLFNAAGKAVGQVTPDFLADLAGKGTKAIQDFAAAHDILPDFASKAMNKGAEVAENVANKPFNAIDKGTQAVVDKAGKIVSSVGKKDPEETIQELIAPKLTAKETKVAINEGRLTRGSDSTLFGKKPDTIAPSDDVVRAAKTINENIPAASKMNDTELHGALSDKIETISSRLRPQMEQVPVKPETIESIANDWKNTKASQFEEPEFDAFAGSVKSQNKFESYLNSLKENPDLGDVWDVRKEYDASIPNNVKNASEASHPNLQWQKQMWLQNRDLLNQVIHDTETGLGGESKKAFADMTDMYTAKENILSKGKADVKGSSGILPNDLKGWVKAGLGVLGADKLSKATIGIGL